MNTLNQKGMTLVEILVAVGIAGGVALLTAQLMKDQYNNDRITQTRAEVGKMLSLAQQLLADKESCNKNFENYTFANAFDAPVSFTELVNKSGKKVIEVGKSYDHFYFSSIRVSKSLTSPGALDVAFAMKQAKGSKLLSKDLPGRTFTVYAAQDPGSNGVVEVGDPWKCGELIMSAKETSYKELCDNLSNPENGNPQFAEWDVASETCKIKEFKCDRGFIPTRISSLGRLICRPVKDALDLNNMIDKDPVSCPSTHTKISISFDSASKRYKINCAP